MYTWLKYWVIYFKLSYFVLSTTCMMHLQTGLWTTRFFYFIYLFTFLCTRCISVLYRNNNAWYDVERCFKTCWDLRVWFLFNFFQVMYIFFWWLRRLLKKCYCINMNIMVEYLTNEKMLKEQFFFTILQLTVDTGEKLHKNR